jgi:hypothetical protein
MPLADKVRAHCRRKYIDPARQHGNRYVDIQAGIVHKDLNLSQRLPAVCAALGTEKFEEECGVERISIVGPLNGSTTTFWFRLEPGEGAGEIAPGDPQVFRLIKICPQCGATTG